ncbi:AbiH family protein [Chryseobacterium sp. CFBP8996]|uniref:AbiH family protein n=1 Tax=Chryseobacterium sp. CFBP8996 TaxID=3096529 RepID=UPI002A6B149F|nr:AbiH family protein [Chryseobacterium sp. CFBP8996]MDY0932986.1 AbiH family protein [Chryseobacterium sp. CFBP8996]
MNRIILIGNGFDLAHGMKTSYGDFIDDYWKTKKQEMFDDYMGKKYQDDCISIDRVPNIRFIEPENDYQSILRSLEHTGNKITYKNEFFNKLNQNKSSLNWVDIENDYYLLLKNCFKKPSKYTIKELNKEFAIIESLLEQYLTKVQKEFINNIDVYFKEKDFINLINEVIYSDFNLRDFSEATINQLTEEIFQKIHSNLKDLESGHVDIEYLNLTERKNRLYNVLRGISNKKKKIKELLTSNSSLNYFRYRPKEILFLNFNYTSTEHFYNNQPIDKEFGNHISTDVIHIHGILNNKTNNKIIFGFGDEIDNDYLEIENLYDNEYLQNIKSMKYLESDSYKKLLEFINSDNYQLFIFGHSCGISDRTLLNTLFEHKNCNSIKPYYRLKADGTDNYSEMIRNISRNFKDKASMRDKVVNKQYTYPLFK